MKIATNNPLLFVIALCLPLLIHGAESVRGEKSSATSTLADAEIKTMLRDYIDADKLGVGMVIGIVG